MFFLRILNPLVGVGVWGRVGYGSVGVGVEHMIRAPGKGRVG